jgi:hypothetical protein
MKDERERESSIVYLELEHRRRSHGGTDRPRQRQATAKPGHAEHHSDQHVTSEPPSSTRKP